MVKFIDGFLNLLYPPKCIACVKVLTHDVKVKICGACFSKLELSDEKVYGEFYFEHVRSFFEYSDMLREIILEIKFGKKAHKMVNLAEVALEFWRDDADEYAGFDAVVPIPLHVNRLRERGFNQAGVFAKVVAKNLELPLCDDLCIREKDTIPQAMMTMDNRHTNVLDAFLVVDDERVLGRSFVLVDDVFTSGETLNSLAKSLKDKGAKKIVCITVCTAYRG